MTREIEDPTESEIADFRRNMTHFSDLEKYPDSVVRHAMVNGRMSTGGKCWGKSDGQRRLQACDYYTAHCLAFLYPEDLAAGGHPQPMNPISSIGVGSQSVSFATPHVLGKSFESWLSTTAYGQMFLQLAAPVKIMAMTTGKIDVG